MFSSKVGVMEEGTFQHIQPKDRAAIQQHIAGSQSPGGVVSEEDLRLIEALRSGNESAFVSLIDMYHSSMLRLAMIFVTSQAVAEEVVQETWMGVLNGLDRFEGRSSLRTWIFCILTNIAKTRAVRDRRTLPFSALTDPGRVPEPAVDADRFLDPEH